MSPLRKLLAGPKTRARLLTGSYVLLLALALAYPTLARRWHETHPVPEDAHPVAGIGSVNGESITVPQLYAALRSMSGPQAMNRLIQQREIMQAALAKHLTVPYSDVVARLPGVQDLQDTEVRSYLEDDMRARLLLRQLCLQNVTEKQKQQTYIRLKPQLVQYGLLDIQVDTRRELAVVQGLLAKGGRFEDLAPKYSRDSGTRDRGGWIGWVTRPILMQRFDTATVDKITSLPSGSTFLLSQLKHPVLLCMGPIRSSYASLKSEVEDVLAEDNKDALLQRLAREARVESPYSSAPSPSPSAITLPGNDTVNSTTAPLKGNAPVQTEPGLLPGNHQVRNEGLNLPSNPEVQGSPSPLAGSPGARASVHP